MRLTLRTMLAYLDRILTPDEAQQLAEKIKTSEFATKLVQFIRGGLRSSRIPAPAPDLEENFGDANDAAEYLDNMLREEAVTDFERYCLENEPSLIEAAACHQILTLVVGKPANIDPKLRQRVYRLPETGAEGWKATRAVAAAAGLSAPATSIASPASADGNGDAAATTPAEPLAAPRQPNPDDPWSRDAVVTRKPREVPDYLKQTRKRGTPWGTILAAAAVSLLLILVALRALGPIDQSHPLIGPLLSRSPEVAATTDGDPLGVGDSRTPPLLYGAADKAAGDPIESTTEPAVDSTQPPPGDAIAAQGDRVQPGPAATAPSTPPSNAGQPGDMHFADDQAPPPPVDEVADATPDTGENRDAAAQEPSASTPPLVPATGNAAGGQAAQEPLASATGAPSAVDPAFDPSLPAPPAPDAAIPDVARPNVVVPDARTADPSVDDAAPLARDLGQLRGEEQVLARWNPRIQDWNRVASRSPVRAGERYFVPPYYRPEVALSNGILFWIVGPAEFELAVATDRPDVIQLNLIRGRFHLDSIAGALPPMQVSLRGRPIEVTLLDADSSLNLHVRPYLPAGSDPQAQAADGVTELIAVRGRATIVAGSPNLVMQPGQGLLAVNQAPLSPMENAVEPAWVSPDYVPPIERIAARTLESAIVPDRPLSLVLDEQTTHRRVEVQSQAQRALAELGSFRPLVASFSEATLHARWAQHFETLQNAIAVDPRFAAALQQELAMHPEGESLYRMSWGYSSEQLATEAAKLVDHLSSEDMAVRVFALENLRRITGKTLSFRPDIPPRDRAQTGRWKKALENGEIK